MPKKKSPTDYRLYIHLPIRAYKDPRMQQHRQALFVLAALCSYTDFRGICWPNQATLAKDLNVSRQAVSRYIRKLINWKYIKYARKEFKGQKGNCYFVIYDPKTTENMARKNVSTVKHDLPIQEQEEAKKTMNKLLTNSKDINRSQQGKRNPQVAQSKGNATSRVADRETSDVARNVSYNVNNNIRDNKLNRLLMIYMKKALMEIYGKDFQYNVRQEDEAQKLIDQGLKVDDETYEKMKAALLWFRGKEPMKDAPGHINFFKSFLLGQNTAPKDVKTMIKRLVNRKRL
jgi:predicted transcriptional regulator|tara:strand:+ start:633 stop:1496 length:864 start_codon:yes stop_codon:yes gene_type:complete